MSEDDKHFIDELEREGDVEYIPASTALKEVIGSGGIPDFILDRADSFIEDNEVDFLPIAKGYLANIEKYLDKLKSTKSAKSQKQMLQKINLEIMQMKAHGGMFNYPIMSSISYVILKFLESTEEINDDLIKIIEAHNSSIQLVIITKTRRQEDAKGMEFVKELQQAVDRFHKKYHSDSA